MLRALPKPWKAPEILVEETLEELVSDEELNLNQSMINVEASVQDTPAPQRIKLAVNLPRRNNDSQVRRHQDFLFHKLMQYHEK